MATQPTSPNTGWVGWVYFAGGAWGRIVGVIVSAMSFFASLAFLPAYPIWGVATLIIDAFIIYALVVHGAEAKVE